jgi:hypothetical protein
LGPRRGRFNAEHGRRLEKPKEFIGHSIALQVRSDIQSFLCILICQSPVSY